MLNDKIKHLWKSTMYTHVHQSQLCAHYIIKTKLVKKLNDQIVNIKLLKYKKNKDMFLVSKVFMDRVSRQ